MARILGLGNPNVTGKIGNIVYTTYKQGVIAKAYQPKVFNPRSRLQVSQRERFKLANLYVKKALNQSKLLYGTGRLSFDRAALMQSFLKSRILKNLGGNFSLESPKLVILPNGENTQLFTTTGKCYSQDKLNIFDWGLTVNFARGAQIGKFDPIWNYQTSKLAWLVDAHFDNNLQADTYYFGCDYVLPDIISVSQIVGVGIKNVPQFSTGRFNVSKIVTSDNNFSIGKNRGLFTSLERCGDGWKYYYSVNGTDLGRIGASLYPAKAISGGKVISTVAAACVVIISASSNASTETGEILGSSLDTIISITANDILNVEPTFNTPGA